MGLCHELQRQPGNQLEGADFAGHPPPRQSEQVEGRLRVGHADERRLDRTGLIVKLQDGGGDDAERPFRADEEVLQVVAGIVLFSLPSAESTRPSAITTSTPLTRSRVLPKAITFTPPALVARLPPIVQEPRTRTTAGTAGRRRRRGRVPHRASCRLRPSSCCSRDRRRAQPSSGEREHDRPPVGVRDLAADEAGVDRPAGPRPSRFRGRAPAPRRPPRGWPGARRNGRVL